MTRTDDCDNLLKFNIWKEGALVAFLADRENPAELREPLDIHVATKLCFTPTIEDAAPLLVKVAARVL